MLNNLIIVGLGCTLAVFTAAAYPAGVYKWVDEKGVIQYSTTPPPGRPAQELRVQPEKRASDKTASGPEAQGKVASGETEPVEATPGAEEGRQDDEKQRAEQQAIRDKVCQELHDNLERMQRYTRLYEKDPQGEITWLTEEQRQQRMEETQKQLKEFCE